MVASTTRVGSEVARRFSIFAVAPAGASARAVAPADVTCGDVATVTGFASVWLTPSSEPLGAVWTTRSPPTTRRPW